MAKTCISRPISQILDPILSATLPDTPVSISSKIIVGMLVYLAIIALRQSIIRDISPPEAHLATSTGLEPVAEKTNNTASLPDEDISCGNNLTPNTDRSNSSERMDDWIASANPLDALFLEI